jgi:DNA-binding IclR family transcriptional regulator
MTGRRSSVRRAARLFASLARSPGMSVIDASRCLDLPYATCHRLLTILVEEGLIERGVEKTYRVTALGQSHKNLGEIV